MYVVVKNSWKGVSAFSFVSTQNVLISCFFHCFTSAHLEYSTLNSFSKKITSARKMNPFSIPFSHIWWNSLFCARTLGPQWALRMPSLFVLIIDWNVLCKETLPFTLKGSTGIIKSENRNHLFIIYPSVFFYLN